MSNENEAIRDELKVVAASLVAEARALFARLYSLIDSHRLIAEAVHAASVGLAALEAHAERLGATPAPEPATAPTSAELEGALDAAGDRPNKTSMAPTSAELEQLLDAELEPPATATEEPKPAPDAPPSTSPDPAAKPDEAPPAS